MTIGFAFKSGETLDFSPENFILRIDDKNYHHRRPDEFPDITFATIGDWAFKYENVHNISGDKLFLLETGLSPLFITPLEGLKEMMKWINTHSKSLIS